MKAKNSNTRKRALTGAALVVTILLVFLYSLGGVESEGYANPENLQSLIEQQDTPHLLIDVRTPGEYQGGYIPTAVNIPLQDLGQGLPEVDLDYLIIVYCRSGNRSAQAARLLNGMGYTNVVDFGGINRWPYTKEYP